MSTDLGTIELPSLPTRIEDVVVSCNGVSTSPQSITWGRISASFGIERIDHEGNAEMLADGLAAGGSITDRLPNLNVPVTYRCYAYTTSGLASYSDYVRTVQSRRFYFNWGDAMASLLANPDFSNEYSDDGALFYPADAENPIYVSGAGRTQKPKVSGTVRDAAEMDALIELAKYAEPVWYRSPDGYKAKVKHGVSWQEGPGVRKRSYTVDMVKVQP